MKVTLKDVLIERELFDSTNAIERAVIAGEILVDEAVATSPSQKVALDAQIRVRGQKRYVSRGGDKLKGAIDAFDIDVRGKRALDIGSSTGGFTDCLLQEGAQSVSCVDVNYGQLAWQLRVDERVDVFERTNIRDVSNPDIGGPFDIIVVDVSFIGLAKIASDIARFSKSDTILIALVKPQFESKRGEAPGGIVQSEKVRIRTVHEVIDAIRENGFNTIGYIDSPITGRCGNIEYLIYAVCE